MGASGMAARSTQRCLVTTALSGGASSPQMPHGTAESPLRSGVNTGKLSKSGNTTLSTCRLVARSEFFGGQAARISRALQDAATASASGTNRPRQLARAHEGAEELPLGLGRDRIDIQIEPGQKAARIVGPVHARGFDRDLLEARLTPLRRVLL